MGSDVRHVRGEAQKELVKKFEVFSSNGRSRWQVWSDWITMSAIAVSNATDQSHFDERENLRGHVRCDNPDRRIPTENRR